jgi:hypothetical protein
MIYIGVAVAMRLHSLSLCFVNAHLAAHTEKNADRHRMFEEIDSGLKVGNNELDMTMQFDHLFWIGTHPRHSYLRFAI